MLGMHGTAYANKAMCECDCIINVGSRFDDRIIGKPAMFGKNAKIIHIDIDAAEVGKMIKADAFVRAMPRPRCRNCSPTSPSCPPRSGSRTSTATRRSSPSATRSRAACACSR